MIHGYKCILLIVFLISCDTNHSNLSELYNNIQQDRKSLDVLEDSLNSSVLHKGILKHLKETEAVRNRCISNIKRYNYETLYYSTDYLNKNNLPLRLQEDYCK